MSRLTQRNEHDTSYFIPQCFEICAGIGCSEDCNDCHVEDSLIEKLGAYEDAEEQGLLLRLPCKVGDTVYQVLNGKIREYRVRSFNIANSYIFVSLYYLLGSVCQSVDCFGKSVFLTKEEAEKKLAEMKGE